MKFSEIVGQHSLKQKLVATVKEGRISHAQLFLGNEGTGALPLALAYAQYLNCQSPLEADSCGNCPSCIKTAKLIHPDLHLSFPFVVKEKEDVADLYLKEFREAVLENPYLSYNDWMVAHSGELKQGNIPKPECASIIRKLSLHTFEGKYKIVVLWLPEYLKDTGNILLKIIEEPPAKTVFLLVAERQELLLPTILSRTQLIKIPRIATDDLAVWLNAKFQIGQQQAHSIALLSEGNLRTAVSLVDHEVSINEELFITCMRVCYSGDGLKILDWVLKISELTRDQKKHFLQYGLHMLRECFLMQYGSAKLVRLRDTELKFVQDFSPLILKHNFQEFNRVMNDASYFIERNANAKLVFHNMANEIERLLAQTKKAKASAATPVA